MMTPQKTSVKHQHSAAFFKIFLNNFLYFCFSFQRYHDKSDRYVPGDVVTIIHMYDPFLVFQYFEMK